MRRFVDTAALYLTIVAAAAVCCIAAAWKPDAITRPDAGLPAPGLDPRLLGPHWDDPKCEGARP